jgi:hypothetical protein
MVPGKRQGDAEQRFAEREAPEHQRPHDDIAKIDSILGLYRKANEIGSELAVAYDSHDKARYDQLGKESDQAMHDADTAARVYGHKVCGNY